MENQLSSGTIIEPASTAWRHFERKGIEIRRIAGVRRHERFEPLRLAKKLDFRVLTIDMLDHVPKDVLVKLKGSSAWSGGATKPLSDGSIVILLNSTDSATRRSATLMEEICHILLRHKPTLIGLQGGSYRTHDAMIEREAYGVGAAVLVPYISLRARLANQKSISDIAKHFGVTTSLVLYRMKGLGLLL